MNASSSQTTDWAPEEVAQRLVRHLDRSLDGHRASGDAFVVSVYGEWGIGKTFCLKSIHELYARRLEERLKGPTLAPSQPSVVIPIWFAPWRYEHEDHLVVPMLKTVEYALEHVAKPLAAAREANQSVEAGIEVFLERNRKLGAALMKGANAAGRVAQALLSAVKFKAAPLGVGFEIDPKAAIEQSQKAAAANAAPQSKETPTLAGRESMYFTAQSELESITHRDPDLPPLRVVMLVDDLDRCLPEKAVQVLESVKLFLNVPGFSFVLAVDDEVVERGIAHRYRDYRLADRDGAFQGDMPISGTQYLEKIVHLPVHLPRWTRARAQAFLLERYPELYSSASSGDRRTDGTGLEDDLRTAKPKAASHGAAPQRPARDGAAATTLALVLDAVPLVPRKLIRLSEGVDYLRSQFADLNQLPRWSLEHAVRVVALQQLHPSLYRHLRQRASRYWRLFDLMRDAWGEPRFGKGESLAALRAAFDTRSREADPVSPTTAGTRLEEETQREKLELLQTVQHSGNQRGAGDPVALFTITGDRPTPTGVGLTQQTFADLYFSGAAPPEAPPASLQTAGLTLPESQIDDPDAAIAALLSRDAVSRTEYLESHRLVGKRLPEPVMTALLSALAQDSEAAQSRALELSWLRDLAQVTSAEQLLALYQTCRVVERWVNALPEEHRR